MSELNIKDFGNTITRLISKENLSRQEAYDAFEVILNGKTSDLQQGAFLAALTSKGETKEEIAGCWEAIYELDTVKCNPTALFPIVENSGTGMDNFKTFNISTAASLIAVADNIPLARHGARAITSKCGTVDIAEALGVDVECNTDIVASSIEKSGIGLFNGMSPTVHPNALGRILSQISFGSTLNIAASLASPVQAEIGVRGVYSKEMITPVVEVMGEIGYKRAIVMYGTIDNMQLGMDEASVCGVTHCAELKEDGTIHKFSFDPKQIGLESCHPEILAPADSIEKASQNFLSLIKGNDNSGRADVAILNAALILYATNRVSSIKQGVKKAKEILFSGAAFDSLTNWVTSQNRDPEAGLLKLNSIEVN